MTPDEQTTLSTSPTEPAPALVVALFPDGPVYRRDPDGEHVWFCVRRNGRTGSEMRLTFDELRAAVAEGARVLK